MKAVVLEETRKISVREVPDAEMQDAADILLRITSTAICGTDLHFYEGRMRGIEGNIIGHEPLGIVEEVGSAVKNVKKGDRVTVPTHICCGFCPMCVEGHSSACLTTNPGAAGAAYGYPNKGGYQGRYVPSFAVALNCGIGSSSLSAEVNAFDRLHIVRGWNSAYFGLKYRSCTMPAICFGACRSPSMNAR